MKWILPICSLFFLPLWVTAQQSGFAIESHISNIIQQGDEAENQNYYDLLLYYFDNPLDLNTSSTDELRQLGLFSTEQIAQIQSHIKSTGKFLGVYELQVLSSFTPQDIKNIMPFITISENIPIGKVVSGLLGGNTNYATLGYSRVSQLAKGYRNQAYLGSPDRMQLRLRLRNPGHLSVGFSAQKDPGEAWLNGNPIPTPDYLSGHIYLENQGRLKQLVLGDYKMQFGQGLLLGSGFMIGKNVETVTSVKQSTLGIMPYTSITESNYFRGGGLTLELSKALQVSMFYSNQYLDATISSGGITNAVSSIRSSGLHRTRSEINARDQLHEQAWGSALTFEVERFSTGVLLVNTQFDKPIIPQSRDYNKYRFTGRNLLNYSWFGQYNAGSFVFFSEVAKSQDAGMAINAGVIGSISKYVSLSLLYRSFDKDFQSLYGLPFAERSSIGNEKGFYWGIKVHPISKLTISAYYDMYQFPWITSTTAAPTKGMDYLVRLEYDINESARMFVQARNEKAQVKELNSNIFTNQPINLLKTIVSFDYNLEHPITFRTRAQYNRFTEKSTANGWLMYQDINYTSMKLGFTGRILIFDTDSYDARQYTYEKDMLFTFNTTVFNGKGLKYYLIMKYKPTRGLSLRLKWAYIEYADRQEIGSGNDLILDNHKTQITGQLHYVF
jgi:hypothetical protein